jgi:hypothetical protein
MQYAYTNRLGQKPAGIDPDASAYIAAVEAADTQSLEAGVKAAYNTFILGLKDDDIWDAIKASCILAGARTLTGALVPLKGSAPTNNNFVSGDYDRDDGLLGNGTSKFLSANRANNADPQNSSHNAVYQTTSPTLTSSRPFIGSGGAATNGSNVIYCSSGSGVVFCGNRITSTDQVNGVGNQGQSVGLVGHTRSGSTNVKLRVAQTEYDEATNNSANPTSTDVSVFTRTGLGIYLDSRLAFYSIGENIDLSLLETRISTLLTDLAAAIP